MSGKTDRSASTALRGWSCGPQNSLTTCPLADEMRCSHEEHLVSAVYQDHRGEQQCKSLPRATQPQSQPAFRVSMTSWPVATPLTVSTSPRGDPGRARRPLVSSSCSTACNTGNGACTSPC